MNDNISTLEKVKITKSEELYKKYRSFRHLGNHTKLEHLKFMGSQPLQLMIPNIIQLFQLRNFVKITPKVDGVRYHMCINKNDDIYLIGRDGEWYSLLSPSSGSKSSILNNNSNYYLFDIELYINSATNQISIFVFDYITVSLGKGSYQKIYKRNYIFRHQKLSELWNDGAIFHTLNNNNLNIKFLYKTNLDFISIIQGSGKDIYEQIIVNWKSEMDTFHKFDIGDVKYDGVIFINVFYKYTFFPQPMYGQYKWKPIELLSMDFKINIKGDTIQLLDKREEQWYIPGTDPEIPKINDDTRRKIKDNKLSGSVYEFVKNEKDELVILFDKGDRNEKGANSKIGLDTTWKVYDEYMNLDKMISLFKSAANDARQFGMIISGDKDRYRERLLQFIHAYHYKSDDNDNVIYVYDYLGDESMCFIVRTLPEFVKMREDIRYERTRGEKKRIGEQIRLLSNLVKAGVDNKKSLDAIGKVANKKSSIRHLNVFFVLAIEIYLKYDSGIKSLLDVKPNKKDREAILEMRKIALGKKNVDVGFCLDTFIHVFKLSLGSLKVEKEIEFIYRSKSNKTFTYVYRYNKKNGLDNMYMFKHIVDDNSEVFPMMDFDIFENEYNYRIKFKKLDYYTSDNPISNPKECKMFFKYRVKKIHYFTVMKYFTIKISFVSEYNRQKSGATWDDNNPTIKSFIDIEFNHRLYFNDNVSLDYDELKFLFNEVIRLVHQGLL